MSTFLDFVGEYNREVAPFIKSYFDYQMDKVSSISPLAVKGLKDLRDFMEGGKKMRGALVLLGYQMFGGDNLQEALKASIAIEIIHGSLLIHDDFMDADSLRRGRMTMHKKYAQKLGERYGNSMAVNLGDAGFFMAFKLLSGLSLPGERVTKAIGHLGGLLTEVVLGQTMDITFEEEKRFSEEEVMLIHRFKTADYTVSGPLVIGAILAGAGEGIRKPIEDYGIPTGIAFQIKDDELGMFSSEEELGKAVDSDIKAGKVTLLIAKALEFSRGEDKKFLEEYYGKEDISSEEVEKIRGIVVNSGALKYSQNVAEDLVEKGKERLVSLEIDEEYKGMLKELGEFVVRRSN